MEAFEFSILAYDYNTEFSFSAKFLKSIKGLEKVKFDIDPYL